MDIKNFKKFESHSIGIDMLIDDYERRLKTVNGMIKDIEDNEEVSPDYNRLTTKASCFRTFLSELKKLK